MKPTSGREVSNLFNGAATGSISSSSRSKNEGDNTSTTIGGFDDIIQRRKEDAFSNASSTSKSIKNLDKNLQSLLLGNVATTSKSNAANNQIAKTSRAAHDFLKEWKRHCTTAKDTLAFLTMRDGSTNDDNTELLLQPDVICKEYFSTDIDSEILGDVVEALHLLVNMKETVHLSSADSGDDDEYCTLSNINNAGTDKSCIDASAMTDLFSSSQKDAISFVHNWLKALASCGRFELSVSFLMPDEQTKLKEICNFLKTMNKETDDSIDELLLRYDTLLK